MTALFRLRDALGRERWQEQVIDSLVPYRPHGEEITVEDDMEQARRG